MSQAESLGVGGQLAILRKSPRVTGSQPSIHPGPQIIAREGIGEVTIINLGKSRNFRRLRHLRVADSYVYHHAVVDNTLSLHYIRSCDNVSDVFTKACDPETFHRLRGYLMGSVSAERKHTHFTFTPLEQSHPRAGECWISSQVSPS